VGAPAQYDVFGSVQAQPGCAAHAVDDTRLTHAGTVPEQLALALQEQPLSAAHVVLVELVPHGAEEPEQRPLVGDAQPRTESQLFTSKLEQFVVLGVPVQCGAPPSVAPSVPPTSVVCPESSTPPS
jgi:hypothetical protein